MDVLVSCIGSIVGSIAGKAAEYTVDPIAKQLSYLFKPKSKFQNLKSKVEELKDAGEEVQKSVDEANRNGEEIFRGVARWLTEANEKISDEAATQLRKDEKKAMKRCFAGFCPHFKSRYQLSKKAEKQANAIAQLLEKKKQFKEVSFRPPLERTSTRPDKDYEAFGSRTGALNRIMAALEDDNFNIFGVYGMGGVGKTALVKEALRQAKDKQLFDEVVLVAIKQTPKTVNIQNGIAKELDLKFDETKFDETSMDERAAQLRKRLKKEEKILIILDDIWVPLDFEKIGVPSADEHKGCKILMTSRKVDVLELMDSQENLPIDILKEGEAWNLFKKMAGQIVERSDLQPTAIEVSKKCAGLPIAIATIAKALKPKKNLFEWNDALRQLRRPSERNFKGIPADAYSAIELSYTFLEREELQRIFLLCSIMGHNAAIADLLRYGIGLGLFHGVNTMEETRDRVLTLVSSLKASCLLLDGSNPEQFDMHDVVRDVAISIASRDRHWLALGRDDIFKEWSDEERMKNCDLISLQDAEVSELLDHEFHLECPNLTFFSMGGEDYSSLNIPNNFFLGMKSLKVLVFSNMHFLSLPSSIGSLKTLRTLCLLYCDLEDIVILGELENLEILSLKGSRIAMLPKEIGQLRRLKLLDLSRCHYLKVISPNVLSSLSRLEELYLYHSFDRWAVEGHDNPSSNASLAELQHLSHLTTLEVHIPNERAMPEDDLFLAKMERYKISIGMQWDYFEDDLMKTSRMLKLKMNKSIHLYEGVKTLLRKTDSLYLDEVKDVMNMLSDPITEGLSHLKHLCIRNVSDIKFVFDSKKLGSCKAFPRLESLSLDNLNNLEAICDGQLKAESFGQLKVIKVDKCQILKNLFSFSIDRKLRQLEEILVSDCKNMTELFIVEKREEEIVENEVIDILEFSQLRSFRLGDLPRFIGLCCWDKKLSSSQQRRVQANATWLFDEKVLFPAMKEMTLDSISNFEKLWHDQLPTMSLGVQILTSLELYGCSKLKYVFTSSMVKSFVQLKILEVFDCDEMEEVIGGILGEEEKVVFPKLGYLRLNYLFNLKRFCSGINLIEFPLLRELHIFTCPVLSTFHCDCTSFGMSSNNISMDHNFCMDVPQSCCFFNEKVALPMLQTLNIWHSENLERLWHNQLAEDSFSKLISIEVRSCVKLLNVFPLCMLTRLQRLQELSIRSCELLEEIFESQQEEGSNDSIKLLPAQFIPSNSDVITFEFSCLTSLTLHELPKLRSFYQKIHTTNWPSLKKLEIYKCVNVEILFASQGINEKSQHEIPIQQPFFWINKVALPKLERLTISSLWSLERVWHNQLAEDSFAKLISIELEGWNKLVNVFPLWMLTRLQKLEELRIHGCWLLEEIFESQQEEGRNNSIQSHSPQLIPFNSDVTTFEFPCLKSLSLDKLPNLKSFCQKIYITNWPSLKTMAVSRCGKVEILFASQGTNEKSQHEIAIQQPLFWVNKSTFPSLHELSLGWNAEMKEIWHCYGQQQLSDYFRNLKFVKLKEFPEQVTILRSYLFQLLSLPNLETLHISWCHFKEIFQSEGVGGEEEPAWVVLSRITELRLHHLKLEINLVPSTVSFQNLVTLEVGDCDGIIKLVTHSTAKSLLQLREMSVYSCQRIEEIIEGGDDAQDEISFPQLNSLELRHLPELESFCSLWNYSFGFPSLQTVIIEDCPKMKMFSQEQSNVPMLYKIRLYKWRNEERWEGNLNSTIQQLFEEYKRRNEERWEGNLNSTIQQLFKEKNAVAEEDESCGEDQSNPSTCNTQDLLKV